MKRCIFLLFFLLYFAYANLYGEKQRHLKNVDQNRETQRQLKMWVDNLNPITFRGCDIAQSLEHRHKSEEIVVRIVPCKAKGAIKR